MAARIGDGPEVSSLGCALSGRRVYYINKYGGGVHDPESDGVLSESNGVDPKADFNGVDKGSTACAASKVE